MGKDENLIAGLLLGALGLIALNEIMKPKCPVCSIEVKKGQEICHRCGTFMGWQQ
jgi:hypothetical protein